MKITRLLFLCGLMISNIACAQRDAKTKIYHGQLVRFGIRDSLQQKLKEKGMDLEAEFHHKTMPFESFNIFLCDVAVIGRVKEIDGMPAPGKEPFHSKPLIEVEQALKGTLSDSNRIEILREGGPFSDR